MDRLIKKVIRHIWGNCYKWRKYSLSLIDNNIKSDQSPAFFQTKSFLNNTCSRIILMYTGIFIGCVVGKKINLAIMLERIMGTEEAVSRNRSDERGVGKEGVSRCRRGGSRRH